MHAISQIAPYPLSHLLGQPLTYQGMRCRVIDILEEGPALVLQGGAATRAIQANQHGEASRRAPPLFTVPLLNVRRDGLNPLLQDLSGLEPVRKGLSPLERGN